jgi:hypothetical protein
MSAPRLVRPLDLGRIFPASIQVYRANAAAILSILFPFYLPIGTFFTIEWTQFSMAVFKSTPQPYSFFGPDAATVLSMFTPLLIAIGVVLVYNMLILPFGFISAFRLIYRSVCEEPITVREALRFAASRYWDFQVAAVYLGLILIGVVLAAAAPIVISLFVGTFLPDVGIQLAIGFSLVMTPLAGIAMAVIIVRFIFFSLVIADEEDTHRLPLGRRGTAILGRAASLIRGHALRVFFYLILIAIVVWLLGQVFMSPIAVITMIIGLTRTFSGGVAHQAPATMGPVTQSLNMLIGQVITLLVQPIAMVAQVLIYVDIKCRREGMDLDARIDAEIGRRQERTMRYRRTPAS